MYLHSADALRNIPLSMKMIERAGLALRASHRDSSFPWLMAEMYTDDLKESTALLLMVCLWKRDELVNAPCD